MTWFKRKPKKRWSGVIELFSHVKSIKQDSMGLILTLDNEETISIPHRSGMRGGITMDMPKHPDLFANRMNFNTTMAEAEAAVDTSYAKALRKAVERDN